MELSGHNTVLIISDDERHTEKILSSFDNINYKYIIAKNHSDALKKITYQLPNIIILHTEISKQNDDYIFCKKIRNSIKTKLIPFVFILPSNNIDERIKAIKYGADAYLIEPFNKEELKAHIVSKVNQFNEFYLLSITDELTRLFNRKEFLKKFNLEINNNKGKILSLAIIDIDNFKSVNDMYGHQMGDIVLMKLAEILKNHASEKFFPSRFGGEEFVIIFPEINSKNAKKIIENVNNEFYETEFNTINKETFKISFSGGLAEYPEQGENLSILLSRADQALYAAKNKGKNRSFIYTPVMARNDKFWEYLNKRHGFYVDNNSRDSATELPFLPHMLEEITKLDFEICSIGLIIIKFIPIYKAHEYLGFQTIDYIKENIKFIIKKSCENNFASDTYFGLSDFFSEEVSILFPSIADFRLNYKKTIEICNEIIKEIKKETNCYSMSIYSTSSVINFEKDNPRKLIHDISVIRKKIKLINKKEKNFILFDTDFNSMLSKNENLNEIITKDYFYDINKKEKIIANLCPKKNKNKNIYIDYILNKNIKNISDWEKFSLNIKNNFNLDNPLILPWISCCDLNNFTHITSKIFKEYKIIISINEIDINKDNINTIINISIEKPDNIILVLDNCYIGKEILNILSLIEFSYIIFSNNLTKNIHFFKERIKIINGLKQFIDQMEIKTCVKDLSLEEEFQIFTDMKIDYFSGSYVKELL